MSLLSANIVVCETILVEKTDIVSAIRMLDSITMAPGNNIVHFCAITRVTSQPEDFLQHTLKVQVAHQDGTLIMEAPEYRFVYGYKVNIRGPGGFMLTTEFNIDITLIPLPASCLVTAFLDWQAVARTPLMLRR